jgi:hypothetical protein
VFIRTSQGFLPGVPLFLQRGLFAVAAWLARVSGVNSSDGTHARTA